MKHLPLKLVEMTRPDGQVGDLDYKLQIKQIITMPVQSQSGISVEDLRRCIRVLDALEKAGDTLDLEDADFEFLKGRILSAKFAFAHPAILQFVDDVTGA